MRQVMRSITSSSVLLTVLAVVMALVGGAVLIVLTDSGVQAAAGYFFSRPTDTLVAIGKAVGGAYGTLIRGGIYDWTAPTFAKGIQSILDSLGFATPLIAAGLGIAIGFRTGVFNIGGQGQILIAGMFAGFAGFALPLPAGLHLLVAVVAGLLGGAIWAGIAGFLKARTGANEVVVTIMLNYIAYYLVDYLLHTPILRAPGSQNPISRPEASTAVFPNILGSAFTLNLGFPLVIVLTVVAAWILNRSSLGFKFRALGENPRAARVAGINVSRVFVLALVLSGAFVGFAGAYEVLGQTTTGFTNGLDAGIGYSAITVTLLGRSRPWGVFAAGIFFGIFQAGGYLMQASQGIDVDILTVVESVIVLFIAAPPLVRSIFRLPTPGPKTKMSFSKKAARAK
jgi:simple sugar transport system permease protein